MNPVLRGGARGSNFLLEADFLDHGNEHRSVRFVHGQGSLNCYRHAELLYPCPPQLAEE